MKEIVGKIVQIVGPIVDVSFPDETLPSILTALRIDLGDEKSLTIEVAQHIGDDVVMNLVSVRPTTSPVMVFQVGDTPYYAPMSATETPINSDTNAKYRVLYNETEYWVHDYTVQ